MKGLLFCVFAIMVLTPVQGEEEEQLMELDQLEQEEEYLECFRCDLGLWDACYTTETNCSRGELCYTGRGRTADSLDVKTLGCAKAEECNVRTTVALFNSTIFVMTKSCCDTHFCNSAQKQVPISTFFHLTLAALTTPLFTKALVR